MTLDDVEARWRAGHILSSQVPEVARELLAAGHDAPALRSLAESDETVDRREARRTFERALRELGRGGMGESEAAMILARGWAEQLVARRLSPSWATRAIAYVRFRGSVDVDEALEPFTELEDEYQTVSRQTFARLRMLPLNRRARAEARRLVERR